MNKVERQLQFEESQASRTSKALKEVGASAHKESMTSEERLLSDRLAALTAAIRGFSEQPLRGGKNAMVLHSSL
jgi:hypothetical protein